MAEVEDDTTNVTKDVLKELSERQRLMIGEIRANTQITARQMSYKMSVNERTIRRDLADLQQKGLLKRVGGRKDGHWELTITEP